MDPGGECFWSLRQEGLHASRHEIHLRGQSEICFVQSARSFLQECDKRGLRCHWATITLANCGLEAGADSFNVTEKGLAASQGHRARVFLLCCDPADHRFEDAV